MISSCSNGPKSAWNQKGVVEIVEAWVEVEETFNPDEPTYCETTSTKAENYEVSETVRGSLQIC